MIRNRRNQVFVGVFLVGFLLDQLTKLWVVKNLALYRDEIQIIPGFLSFIHAQNPGAALGLLRHSEYKDMIFLVVTILCVGVVIDLFRRLPQNDVLLSSTLGLIFSGAMGNALDRFRQSYVTDFIKVYTENNAFADWLVATIGTSEYPTFNVADASLVVGVGVFIFHHIFLEEDDTPPAAAPSSDALEDTISEDIHDLETEEILDFKEE